MKPPQATITPRFEGRITVIGNLVLCNQRNEWLSAASAPHPVTRVTHQNNTFTGSSGDKPSSSGAVIHVYTYLSNLANGHIPLAS